MTWEWRTSVREFEADYSVLDTHFHLAQHGQLLLEPPEVFFLRLFGQADGFGERFILIIFRNERFDFVDIERGVGVKPPLDGLQLGTSIEVNHSGCVEFMLVEWW